MGNFIGKLMGEGVEKLSRRLAKPATEVSVDLIDAEITRKAGKKLAPTFGEDLLIKSDAVELRFGKAKPKTKPKVKPKAAPKPPTREELQQLATPTVLREPRDPAILPTPKEQRHLESVMRRNGVKEREALKTLSMKDRERFHMLNGKMKSRVDGQLGLQQLLLDGKLTMGSAKDPNRSLIEALHDLSERKLEPSIDRQTMLAQLHQELADPVAVSQEHKGTCAATADGQILWSLRQPTDYTDFLADLASPTGKATLPNGTVVKRKPDWRAGNDRIPGRRLEPGTSRNNGRTISSQLTEPVFMQTAMGDGTLYSNTFDQQMSKLKPGFKVGGGGLSQEERARLLESLFPGEKYSVSYASPDWLKASYQWSPKKLWNGERNARTEAEMIEYLSSAASVDSPVPASVNYQLGGGHAILVTGVRSEVVEVKGKKVARGMVDYVNPWGRYETQSVEGFALVLNGIITNGSVPGVKR